MSKKDTGIREVEGSGGRVEIVGRINRGGREGFWGAFLELTTHLLVLSRVDRSCCVLIVIGAAVVKVAGVWK